MKVLIITGSHKENSESVKLAERFKNEFLTQFSTKKIHELATLKIPFWDEDVWKGTPEWRVGCFRGKLFRVYRN